MSKRKHKKIRKAEGGFGGQTLQPPSTHGILDGPSNPAFSLKLIGLASTITLLFSGTCASSQKLSECLSLSFRGRKVRSPSLVRPGAWNYRVCIRTPLCGTSVAHISSRVLLLCFLCVGMLCCLGSALSVLNVGAWNDVFCFDFEIWLLKLSILFEQQWLTFLFYNKDCLTVDMTFQQTVLFFLAWAQALSIQKIIALLLKQITRKQ